jgi:hypothetical protein
MDVYSNSSIATNYAWMNNAKTIYIYHGLLIEFEIKYHKCHHKGMLFYLLPGIFV